MFEDNENYSSDDKLEDDRSMPSYDDGEKHTDFVFSDKDCNYQNTTEQALL